MPGGPFKDNFNNFIANHDNNECVYSKEGLDNGLTRERDWKLELFFIFFRIILLVVARVLSN